MAVELNGGGGSKELTTKNVLIATGSDVMPLPSVTIDERRIVSSTGALDLKQVPGHLLIVGAGYIGLEMGTVWRRLGSKVTVVEFLDRITPGMDGEVAKEFQKILTKQGMAFKLGTKVTGVDSTGDQVKVTVEPAKGGATETIRVRYGVGLDRPAALHGRALGLKRLESSWTIAAGSRPTAISAPACPASGRSAT